MLAALNYELNGAAMSWADDELLNDRSFILEAVQQHDRSSWTLEYVPNIFHEDREIMIAACKTDGHAISWASGGLSLDRELALIAAKQSGSSLREMIRPFCDDFEIVLAAVTEGVRRKGLHCYQTECGLRFASERLKADRRIVLAAIEHDWTALQFASNDLKAAPEVVLLSCAQNKGALLWCSDELKNGGFDAYCRRELRDQRAMEAFWMGVSVSSALPPLRKRTSLNVLEGPPLYALGKLGALDPETLTSLLMLISDFLGTPRGRFLQRLRAWKGL